MPRSDFSLQNVSGGDETPRYRDALVLEGDCKTSRFDRPLIKAIARARRWSRQLLSRETPSIRAIARQERIAPRYVRDLLPLGFLSPRIIEAILERRRPPNLTVIGLTRRIDLRFSGACRSGRLVLAIRPG